VGEFHNINRRSVGRLLGDEMPSGAAFELRDKERDIWGIELINASCALRPDVEAVYIHTASPTRRVGERFLSTHG